MASVDVFISYRRDGDIGRSALVYKAIEGRFHRLETGVEVSVYRDVDQRLGIDWPDEIEHRLSGADIVVVLIGPEWLAAVDEFNRRRIDQEDDWVRKEIAYALAQESVVIPVVFDGTPVPPREALPESIAELADRRALQVRTENFDLDIQPLLWEIDQHGKDGDGISTERLAAEAGHAEWPYPDPPLAVKPAQMSDLDIETALEELLNDWEVVDSPIPEDPHKKRVELFRKYEFPTFGVALEFMNETADFCERANHHPRWENIYKTVWIYLTSWDIGHRISHLDVILASHVDKLAVKYDGT